MSHSISRPWIRLALGSLLLSGLVVLSGGLAHQASAFFAEDEKDPFAAEIEGLRKFQFLIGNWRASSQIPDGKKTGTVEDLKWAWHFVRDEPPALKVAIQDGDFLRSGLLRYDAQDDKYLFVAERVIEGEDKKPKTETVIFEGKYEPSKDDPNVNVLAMVRKITGSPLQEQVTLRLREKHHYIFQLDQRRSNKLPFRPMVIFSTTREGESIAKLEEAAKGPECFISGGLGTSSMTYKGKVYYFCCSGCSESFKENPEKWIAEVEKKKVTTKK